MEVPIATVVTLAIALVSAGAVIGKLISVAERVKALEKGASDQGRRIGQLEADMRVDVAVRKATGWNAVVTKGGKRPGGGQVAGPVDDDDSEEGSRHG